MLTEKVLKNHVAFRKKLLLGKKYFSHKDIFFETFLRAVVFSSLTEVYSAIDNVFRGRVIEFRPIRFWAIVIGLSVITPLQLYLVNWKIHRNNNKK